MVELVSCHLKRENYTKLVEKWGSMNNYRDR